MRFTFINRFDGLKRLSNDTDHAAVFDPVGNGVGLLVIKSPPIDCLRESLGTISGKRFIPRGNFADH